MKKKMFTRFVCLVLAALCLPVVSAFAAVTSEKSESASTITQTISELRVKIEVPAGGRAPSFEAKAFPSSMLEYKISTGTNVEDSVHYSCLFKNGIQWYDLDNGRALKEGEAFVTGTRYRVDIIIHQTYETDFNGTPYYKYPDDLKGYVNGAEADVTSGILPLNIKWFRQLSYTFPPCADAPDDMTSVFLWLDSPVAGAAPDFTYTTNDKGYKAGEDGTDAVNGVTWYDSTGNTISPSMKFAEGETYTVAIELKATSPYRFATNTDGTSKVRASINGYGATVYCSYQEVADMDETIWVRYTFETC